jgi:hypothetical protein
MTETVDKSEVEAADEFELDLSKFVMSKDALDFPELAALVAMAGQGKTHSALAMTEVDGLWPVLVLDTEGSTVGVAQNFDPERFDVIRINTHKQLEQVVNSLLTKTHKYKTVVIDTIDTAQERALLKFEKDNPGDGFAKWGEVAKWLLGDAGLLPRLKAAPFFAVVICHSREEKSESGAIIQKVKLQGSAKDNFASAPDVVFYQTRKLAKVGDETLLQTKVYTVGTKAFDQAKNRFGLPYVMEDATLATVFKAIRAKIDERKAAKNK